MKKLLLFCVFFCIFNYTINFQVKAFAGETEKSLVFSDSCEQMQNVRLYKGVSEYLSKAGIPLSLANSVKLPKGWGLTWGSFSSETFIDGKTSLNVNAPPGKPVEIFAHSTMPDKSRFYTIEMTVSMPLQSKYKSSKVQIGIFRYGYNKIPRKIFVEEKLYPGEQKTIKALVDLSDDFCHFRPLTLIEGNIEIQNLSLWKHSDDLAVAGRTVVEGVLKECSELPDPKKSSYPDCRFVCRFEGNSIIAGKPCPKEMALVLEGFENRKYKKARELKPGDMVRMLIVPFDELPTNKKTTQQADDLQLYMLDSYYVEGVSKVTAFVDGNVVASSGILFSDNEEEYTSVFKLQLNPPMSEKLQKDRDIAVKKAMNQLDKLLYSYDAEKIMQLNKEFQKAWRKEYQKDLPGKNRVKNTVWRNVDGSFWALPLKYNLVPSIKSISQNNLNALVAFKDFLQANGVHLIVVPIPDLYDISARVINKKFSDVPDFQTASVVKQFLENDIEAIYISDEIIKNYNRYPFAFFYPDNAHPADTVQDVISDELADRLKRYGFSAKLDPNKFLTVSSPHVYNSDKKYFFPFYCDIGNNVPGVPYQCRRVLYEGKDIFSDSKSEIFVIGNSFIQTPMDYPESLPALLMQKLCMKVSTYRMESFGPVTQIIPAFFWRSNMYLTGKKVVILAVGNRVFTSDINIPDIRVMDAYAMALSGKSLVCKYDIAQQLERKHKSRKIQILQLESAKWNPEKEAVLVFHTLNTDLNSKAYLSINGDKIEIPHVHKRSSVPYLVVYKIPSEARSLQVELEGNLQMSPIVSNIQIYQ